MSVLYLLADVADAPGLLKASGIQFKWAFSGPCESLIMMNWSTLGIGGRPHVHIKRAARYVLVLSSAYDPTVN